MEAIFGGLHLKKGSFKTLLKSYTKHFLIVITSAMTFGAIGLLRVMLGESQLWTPIARAIYWEATSYFGFAILVYPWWLATSKSPFYYGRLRKYVIILGVIGFALRLWRSLLAPISFDKSSEQVKANVNYRIVSIFWWLVCLVGFTVVLAFAVRKSKILKAKSLALYTFVIPFIAIIFVGTVVSEWTGRNYAVVYSPVLLLVQPLIVAFIDSKVYPNQKATFNEIYIIIAGFVPFWLAATLGDSLLELLQRTSFVQELPFGTLVIFSAWKLIVLGFQKISAIIGQKASRTSDGHVFSFAAIYTGSTLGEFIFLSVTFNSLKFWALVVLQVVIIAALQGGTEIDVEWLVLNFVKWEFWGLKALVLNLLADMPSNLIEEVMKYPMGAEYPLHLSIQLIRSRATTLQLSWSESEIKLSSEFQTVTCALMAVLADLFYDYFDVGSEFIGASRAAKEGLVWIFLVSLGSRFVGQAIARRRLRQKVTKLKDDMADAVDALQRVNQVIKKKRESVRNAPSVKPKKRTTPKRMGVITSLIPDIFLPEMHLKEEDEEEEEQRRDAGDKLLNASAEETPDTIAINGEASDVDSSGLELSSRSAASRASNRSSLGVGLLKMFTQGGDAYDEVDTDEQSERKNSALASVSHRGSLIGSNKQSRNKSILWNPLAYMEKEEEENNEAVFDLVDILNTANLITADECSTIIPQAAPSSQTVTSKRQTVDSKNPLQAGGTDEDDPDDWGDINLAPFEEESTTLNLFKDTDIFSAEKQPATVTSVFKMQGYLGKLKPGTSYFQRRYFVLTKENLLIYYKSMSDITKHVGASKGIIDLRTVKNLNMKDGTPLAITFYDKERLYTLQSYTDTEARSWYAALEEAMLSLPNDSGAKKDVEAGETETEKVNGAAMSPSLPQPRISQSGAMPAPPLCAMKRKSVFSGSTRLNSPQVQVGKPTRRGQLMLKGSFFWQDLWFTLTADGELAWYVGDPSVSGSISVKKGYLQVSDILSIDQDKADPCCFDINVKGYTHEIQGHSEQASREWILDIMTWIQAGSIDESKGKASDGTAGDRVSNVLGGTPSAEVLKMSGIDVESGSLTKVFGTKLTKRGWLNKKNALYWQRRWFELIPPGELIWYASDHDAFLGESRLKKDSIMVCNVLSIDLDPSDGCRIDVNIKGRVYELKADSEGEVLAWYTALNSWMDTADNNRMPSENSSGKAVPRMSSLYDRTRARTDSGGKFSNVNPMASRRASQHRSQRSMTTSGVSASTSSPMSGKHLPTRKGNLMLSILFNTRHDEYWFVLSSNGELSWYMTEQDCFDTANQKGCVRMADVLDVVPSESYPNCFDIKMEGHKYEIQAHSEAEAIDWISDLQAWLGPIDVDDNENDPHTILEELGDDGEEKEGAVLECREDVLKSGWVQKKNAVYWQTRWLEILKNGELNWYISDRDAALGLSRRKGTLNMSTVVSVDKNYSVKSSFNIETKGRTYSIKANSDLERNNWCDALASFFVTSPQYAQVLTRRITRVDNESGVSSAEENGRARRGSVYSMDSRKNSLTMLSVLTSNGPSLTGHNVNNVPFSNDHSSTVSSIGVTSDLSVAAPVSQQRRCSAVVMAENRARTVTNSSQPDILPAKLPQRTKRASAVFSNAFMRASTAEAEAKYGEDSRERSTSNVSELSMEVEKNVSLQDVMKNFSKAGWLRKKGGVGNRTWQKRWFVLSKSGANTSMYWFKSEQNKLLSESALASALKGKLKVSDILSVDQHPHDARMFDVNVKGRSYELQANGVSEALEWHNAVADAISVSERLTVSSRMSTLLSARDSVQVPGGLATRVSNLNDVLSECENEMIGYLELRNNANSNVWKNRWFVLGRPDVLSWFQCEMDVLSGASVGTITIADMLSVDMSDSSHDCFEINVKGRTYELRAASAESARQWCTMLLLRIEKNTLESLEAQNSNQRSSLNSAIQKNILGYSYLSVGTRRGSARGSFTTISFNKHARCGLLCVRAATASAERTAEQDMIVSRKVSFDPTGAESVDEDWVSCWFQLSLHSGLTWMQDGKILNRRTVSLFALKDIKRVPNDLCSFEVVTNSETIVLRASSELEANKWCVSLRESVEECKSRVSRSQSDPLMINTEAPGVFSGLEKRGYLMKTNTKSGSSALKKNWFVLREPGILLWYTTEEDEHRGNMKGSLLLESVDWVQEPSQDAPSTLTFCVQENVFDVHAYSNSEALDWFSAMGSWICTKSQFRINTLKGDMVVMKKRVSTGSNVVESPLQAVEAQSPTDAPVEEIIVSSSPMRIKEGDLLLSLDEKSLNNVKRWFVAIHSSDWYFSWYLNEVDARNDSVVPEGEIRVCDIDVVNQSSRNPCRFEVIDVSGKTFVMQANSADAVLEWCDALKVCMTSFSLHPEEPGKGVDEVSLASTGDEADTELHESQEGTRRARGESVVLGDEGAVDLDTLRGAHADISPTELSVSVDKPKPGIIHSASSNFKLFEPVDESKRLESGIYSKLKDSHGTASTVTGDDSSNAVEMKNENIATAWKFISGLDEIEIKGESVEGSDEDIYDESGEESDIDNDADMTVGSVAGDGDDEDLFEPIGHSSISAVINSLPSAWKLEYSDDDEEIDYDEAMTAGASVQHTAEDTAQSIVPQRGHSVSIDSTATVEILEVDAAGIQIAPQRRTSDTANKVFMRMNTEVDGDEFVNNLKTHSYRDLNAEFWFTHRYYLLVVVCFVTLQVLYAIAEIVRSVEEYE